MPTAEDVWKYVIASSGLGESHEAQDWLKQAMVAVRALEPFKADIADLSAKLDNIHDAITRGDQRLVDAIADAVVGRIINQITGSVSIVGSAKIAPLAVPPPALGS